MQHFLIYTNKYKDKNLATTEYIRDFLTKHNCKVTVIAEGEQIPESADVMLVLGGDGTVLQAARESLDRNIPIIGVNMGTLGYMTEIEPANLEEALEQLLLGKYETEGRMMLKGALDGDKTPMQEEYALNDIVLSRRGPLQIIKFHVYVNGQLLNTYEGDGIILTTPTGSTGYNLSAGGPLVAPKAELIVMTPICPHSLNQRSVVFSAEDCIEIEVPLGRDGKPQQVEVSFDGTVSIPLKAGDKLSVKKADRKTTFLQLSHISFLDILSKKMAN